jgi:hypothetical protein
VSPAEADAPIEVVEVDDVTAAVRAALA